MKICKVRPTRKKCRKCNRDYSGILSVPPCEMCRSRYYQFLDYCVDRGKGYAIVERDGKVEVVNVENIYDFKNVSKKEFEESRLKIWED
ncbi:hypothetical protein [uncultured Thomasclavelia sp.]|uniref:hypothetical protein n=1 Tax=uncultured Thomasclavelia sp. TaxID=3025759 RepID=UPI002629E8C4|nr:hypothetical protein [uncultured Thomasclavelia sp.]